LSRGRPAPNGKFNAVCGAESEGERKKGKRKGFKEVAKKDLFILNRPERTRQRPGQEAGKGEASQTKNFA